MPSFTVYPGSTGCASAASAIPGFTTVNCSGFEAVRSPKWTGGVRYTHEINLGSGKLIPTVGASFSSSRWLNTEFTPIERAKGYVTLDGALTYQAPKSRYSITGFVRNINNAHNYSTAIISAVGTAATANIAAPRTYGVRLAFKYD